MTFETNRFEDNNLQLIDFSEEDDYLIAFPHRDSLEDLRLSVSFDNVNERTIHVQSEPRRQSFLRKSLAWDNAFFTSAGVLNHEELFLINRGFRQAESNNSFLTPQKDGQTSQPNTLACKKMMNTCSQNKVKSVRVSKGQSPNLQGTIGRAKTRVTDNQIIQDKTETKTRKAVVEGSNNAKTETKTRKAGTPQDLTASKKSRSGDLSCLPKSTSLTSPKVNHSCELSSSSASSSKTLSKSTKRKVNPKKKPVNPPSLSTCSSNTSPASSIDGWFSESLTALPVLDFRSQNIEDGKFVSQNATRSSIGTGPFSGGPRRKIKPSGLRMPSPKLGFFDEEPNRSMQDRFGGRSPTFNESEFNKLHLKSGGQTPKEILKMKMDRKRAKDEKENVCSFEDQVNGLSRQLEVIDLAVGDENSTPCSRTPLAKKNFGFGEVAYL